MLGAEVNLMRIKPFYSLRELGLALECSKVSTRTLLRQAGVKVARLGNRDIVYATHIRDAMPDLWRSIELTAMSREMWGRDDR